MIQEYDSWAHLNDEGMKKLGDIFPDKIIPILSIIHQNFEHPDFEETQSAYLLSGPDLTEVQLNKLVEKTVLKFGDEDKQDEIRKIILNNQLPIRTCLVSGAGTKNVHMFLDDGFEDDMVWGEMMDEQNQREMEDWENEFGDDRRGIQ